MLSVMFLVSFVVKSTSLGVKSDACGTSNTSSNVRPSLENFSYILITPLISINFINYNKFCGFFQDLFYVILKFIIID